MNKFSTPVINLVAPTEIGYFQYLRLEIFLIIITDIAQAHNIGILQEMKMVKISDEEAWNRSGKLSNSPSFTLKLLLLLPYPNNTITRSHIPL